MKDSTEFLLDFQPSAGGNGLNLLRHRKLQDAVSVLCLNAVDIYAGNIKASAEASIELSIRFPLSLLIIVDL